VRFLDEIQPELRERLLAAGKVEPISAGTLLIRRGERNGDLFLIESGSFEVVDTRNHPEIVLDVVGRGAVLGELTFVDDAPRGADVRAAEPSTVRTWNRAATLQLFAEDPHLAADFYRAVARTLSNRFRAVSGTVATGGFSGGRGAVARQDLTRQVRDHASEVLHYWIDADESLRRDNTDRRGRTLVKSGLDLLLGDITRWLTSLPDLDDRAAAGTMLSRELRPLLNRAVTGERVLDTLGQATGDPRLLAHIIRGEAAGDDTFGHTLDAHLLDLPTFVAIRERARRLVEVGRTVLPAQRSTDLLILHPNCGAVLVGLLLPMSAAGGRVRVVDGNRTVLGLVDAGLPRRPPRIDFTFFQADIAAIALGRADVFYDPHHLVVLDGLLDHLPDRLAVQVLGWAARHLAPGGTLLCSGLAPSPDALFVDHILGWPLVRREPSAFARMVASVPGLDAEVVSGKHTGIVLRATSTR
jgi:extracellular factor (EF) 3-hydroxypalmitic acid methyl ester biosynthesis protein